MKSSNSIDQAQSSQHASLFGTPQRGVSSQDILIRYSEVSLGELKNHYKTLSDALFITSIKNELLERYLSRVQPSCLTGIPLSVELSASIAQRIQTMITQNVLPPKLVTGSSFKGSSTSRSIADTISDFGSQSIAPSKTTFMSSNQRLSDQFFLDLITREIEEMKASLEQFDKDSKKTIFNLEALIEEKKSSLGELNALAASFEHTVMIDGSDPTTGKISSQKFLKFINETTLRDLDLRLGKMRLRCSTLRGQLQRAKSQFEQRVELGESVHAVDFDELTIQNRNLARIIEEKNIQILKLKSVTAVCGQNLLTNYRSLERLLEENKNSLLKIKEKENILEKLINEGRENENGIISAQKQNFEIEELISTYTAPSVFDYIKLKAELQEVRRNMNVWTRKVNLQQNTINLLTHKLKSKTGQEQKTHWLRKHGEKSMIGSESTEDTSTNVLATAEKSVSEINSRINL